MSLGARRAPYLAVGSFVLAMALAGAFLLARLSGGVDARDHYATHFDSVLGVVEGTPVLFEGFPIGLVTGMTRTPGQEKRFRVELAVREGLRPPVPSLDPRPLLTMADMGHGHMDAMKGMEGGCGANMKGMEGACGASMGHAMPAPKPASTDAHAGHAMPGMDHGDGAMQAHPASETNNPLVDMQTMTPAPKLDDPGIGLRDNGRKVATYADLRSRFADPDGREPVRTSYPPDAVRTRW